MSEEKELLKQVDVRTFWEKLWCKKFIALLLIAIFAAIGYNYDTNMVNKLTDVICQVTSCSE